MMEDVDHYGGVNTPLLGPATITKKGVELGRVVGLHRRRPPGCKQDPPTWTNCEKTVLNSIIIYHRNIIWLK